MRETRVRVAGIELAAAVDAARADRITHSAWWRYLGRPWIQLLNRPQSRRPNNGSVQPDMHTNTWTVSGNGASSSPAIDPNDPEAVALQARISGKYWYHALDLGHGVVTPGFVDNRQQINRAGFPEDLTGKRCLDIGTFDGFWAFEMERRGAAEVVALDLNSLEEMDLRRLTRQQFIDEAARVRGTTKLGGTFEIARDILGSRVERKVVNVYELSPEKVGMFDVVHCSDVIPHLRDPRLAVENIASVTSGIALLGSAFDPSLDELGQPLVRVCPSGGDFVWWWYSCASLKMMMEQSGLHPVEEVSRIRVDNRAGAFWKVYLRGHAQA